MERGCLDCHLNHFSDFKLCFLQSGPGEQEDDGGAVESKGEERCGATTSSTSGASAMATMGRPAAGSRFRGQQDTSSKNASSQSTDDLFDELCSVGGPSSGEVRTVQAAVEAALGATGTVSSLDLELSDSDMADDAHIVSSDVQDHACEIPAGSVALEERWLRIAAIAPELGETLATRLDSLGPDCPARKFKDLVAEVRASWPPRYGLEVLVRVLDAGSRALTVRNHPRSGVVGFATARMLDLLDTSALGDVADIPTTWCATLPQREGDSEAAAHVVDADDEHDGRSDPYYRHRANLAILDKSVQFELLRLEALLSESDLCPDTFELDGSPLYFTRANLQRLRDFAVACAAAEGTIMELLHRVGDCFERRSRSIVKGKLTVADKYVEAVLKRQILFIRTPIALHSLVEDMLMKVVQRFANVEHSWLGMLPVDIDENTRGMISAIEDDEGVEAAMKFISDGADMLGTLRTASESSSTHDGTLGDVQAWGELFYSALRRIAGMHPHRHGFLRAFNSLCADDVHQRTAALAHCEQPVRIVAGPGSGKTRTILLRVISLFLQGVQPHEVVIITFSRAAKEELRRRLVALERFGILRALSAVSISTITSFALRLLDLLYQRLRGCPGGAARRPQILDDVEATSTIADYLQEVIPESATKAQVGAMAKMTLDLLQRFVSQHPNVLSESMWDSIPSRFGRWLTAGDATEAERPADNDLLKLKLRLKSAAGTALDECVHAVACWHEQRHRGMMLLGEVEPRVCCLLDSAVHNAEDDAEARTFLEVIEPYTRSYYLVDEFQDTSTTQYKMLKRLICDVRPVPAEPTQVAQLRPLIFTSPSTPPVTIEFGAREDKSKFVKRVTVVGDVNQCLYEWRGAVPELMERSFCEDFGAVTVYLRTNYRSSASIVSCINNLIQHNYKRGEEPVPGVPGAKLDSAPRVCFRRFAHVVSEFDFVLGKIHTLHSEEDVPFGEIMVLARLNRQLSEFAEYSRKRGFNQFQCRVDDSDARPSGSFVRVMTVHAAKGLEARAVFVLGLQANRWEQGYFCADGRQTAQERRVAFVACSRARRELFVTCTGEPSVFFNELQADGRVFFPKTPPKLRRTRVPSVDPARVREAQCLLKAFWKEGGAAVAASSASSVEPRGRIVTSVSKISDYFFYKCPRKLHFELQRVKPGELAPSGSAAAACASPCADTDVEDYIRRNGNITEEKVLSKIRDEHRIEVIMPTRTSADDGKAVTEVYMSEHEFYAKMAALPRSSDPSLYYYVYQPSFEGLHEPLVSGKSVSQLAGLPCTSEVAVLIRTIRPDLLRVRRTPDGCIDLQVIDIKSSQQPRVSHKVQVALYAVLLKQLFAHAARRGAPDDCTIAVNIATGGIWCAGMDTFAEFPLPPMIACIKSFLSSEPRGDLLSAVNVSEMNHEDTDFHLSPVCGSCPYVNYCRGDARRREHLSLARVVSPYARRAIESTGIRSVGKLQRWVRRLHRSSLIEERANEDLSGDPVAVGAHRMPDERGGMRVRGSPGRRRSGSKRAAVWEAADDVTQGDIRLNTLYRIGARAWLPALDAVAKHLNADSGRCEPTFRGLSSTSLPMSETDAVVLSLLWDPTNVEYELIGFSITWLQRDEEITLPAFDPALKATHDCRKASARSGFTINSFHYCNGDAITVRTELVRVWHGILKAIHERNCVGGSRTVSCVVFRDDERRYLLRTMLDSALSREQCSNLSREILLTVFANEPSLVALDQHPGFDDGRRLEDVSRVVVLSREVSTLFCHHDHLWPDFTLCMQEFIVRENWDKDFWGEYVVNLCSDNGIRFARNALLSQWITLTSRGALGGAGAPAPLTSDDTAELSKTLGQRSQVTAAMLDALRRFVERSVSSASHWSLADILHTTLRPFAIQPPTKFYSPHMSRITFMHSIQALSELEKLRGQRAMAHFGVDQLKLRATAADGERVQRDKTRVKVVSQPSNCSIKPDDFAVWALVPTAGLSHSDEATLLTEDSLSSVDGSLGECIAAPPVGPPSQGDAGHSSEAAPIDRSAEITGVKELMQLRDLDLVNFAFQTKSLVFAKACVDDNQDRDILGKGVVTLTPFCLDRFARFQTNLRGVRDLDAFPWIQESVTYLAFEVQHNFNLKRTIKHLRRVDDEARDAAIDQVPLFVDVLNLLCAGDTTPMTPPDEQVQWLDAARRPARVAAICGTDDDALKLARLGDFREVAKALSLTESQVETAVQGMASGNPLQLVVGPAGSGKTHYIAGLLWARLLFAAQSDTSCRIWLTSHQHSAIDEVILKMIDICEANSSVVDFAESAMKRTRTTTHALGEAAGDDATMRVDAKSVVREFIQRLRKFRTPKDVIGKYFPGQESGDAPKKQLNLSRNIRQCVLAGTVWEMMKVPKRWAADIVVVDEASQVSMVDSSMILGRVERTRGQLMLVGDHHQLQPINKLPLPEAGHAAVYSGILDSLFNFLRGPLGSRGYMATLTENWRMNECLCRFAAKNIYGDMRIMPATDDISSSTIGDCIDMDRMELAVAELTQDRERYLRDRSTARSRTVGNPPQPRRRKAMLPRSATVPHVALAYDDTGGAGSGEGEFRKVMTRKRAGAVARVVAALFDPSMEHSLVCVRITTGSGSSKYAGREEEVSSMLIARLVGMLRKAYGNLQSAGHDASQAGEGPTLSQLSATSTSSAAGGGGGGGAGAGAPRQSTTEAAEPSPSGKRTPTRNKTMLEDVTFWREKVIVFSTTNTRRRMITDALLRPQGCGHGWACDASYFFVSSVNKAQGQTADVAICAYDFFDKARIDELAAFLFDRQRIVVSVTRARVKTVFVTSDLVEQSPAGMEADAIAGFELIKAVLDNAFVVDVTLRELEWLMELDE